MNLIEVAKLTEKESRDYLESIRWPDGAICAHCQSKNVSRLGGKAGEKGQFKCKNKECRKKFTVTVGTLFADSHIPLSKWLLAFHLVCSSKKGMSAHQLHRELGITYKSAWFMAHRIRYAMTQEPLSTMLTGTVEVDETYVGGKSKGKRGRGADKKTPVVALVERNGKVKSKPVKRVTAKELKGAIRENVTTESTIMTDEWPSYKGIGKEYEGGHHVVNHGQGEYARGDVNTNSAESYFALLKRGVNGTFHHVSEKHLHRYCDEFSFRWGHRKDKDSERRDAALKLIEGRRLLYKKSDNS